MNASRPASPQMPTFSHMVYPYAGQQQYLSGTLAYIEQARAAGATVVVAAPEQRRDLLRGALGGDEHVTFMDTAALGRNPARLIPAWRQWIGAPAERGAVYGVSEPSWPLLGDDPQGGGRYEDWLLNVAFAQAPAWTLLCPVDTTGAPRDQVEAMARCHPLLWNGTAPHNAEHYLSGTYPFERLPEPPSGHERVDYALGDLRALRERIGRWAERHRLPQRRTRELTLAVSEVATNSVRYGGGGGTLRYWVQDGSLVCEVRDAGVITDPLVGRVPPTSTQVGGRGLWFVNQLCDVVQIRSAPDQGTRVRLWFDLPGAPHGGDEGARP